MAKVQAAGENISPAARFVDWAVVGHGGSADVYRVFDTELEVPLAIKILKSVHHEDRRYIESLRREVLISRKLRHRNICPIHDLYEGPQGIGIVMDLLEGHDLKYWMRLNRENLLATLDDRINILKKITQALSEAHRLISHRDLKPGNILLRDDNVNEPVILDFGLSSQGAVNAENAIQGGTPKYMAPEQYSQLDSADSRVDIFSLGIIAYELLTDGKIPVCSLVNAYRVGHLPAFERDDVLAPSRFCSAIPAELDRLVLQMLEYVPENRPQAASEILDVLNAVSLIDPFENASQSAVRETQSVLVSEGSYFVGERRSARACDLPRRKVRLGSFRIASSPVTNSEYRNFLNATGYRKPELIDHPQFGAVSAPVVMVSWSDAQNYAKWSGARLPSELEWEVAAKAGEPETNYPWGDGLPRVMQANIDGLTNCTTAVGSYVAGKNPWGLNDCCGNVWEWCADPWDPDLLQNAHANDLNLISHTNSELRAIRGGSFAAPIETGRCSFRHHAPSDCVRSDIGFRIAFDC